MTRPFWRRLRGVNIRGYKIFKCSVCVCVCVFWRCGGRGRTTAAAMPDRVVNEKAGMKTKIADTTDSIQISRHGDWGGWCRLPRAPVAVGGGERGAVPPPPPQHSGAHEKWNQISEAHRIESNEVCWEEASGPSAVRGSSQGGGEAGCVVECAGVEADKHNGKGGPEGRCCGAAAKAAPCAHAKEDGEGKRG